MSESIGGCAEAPLTSPVGGINVEWLSADEQQVVTGSE